MADEDFGWQSALQGLPAGYGRVLPNDPRIPKPAPDPIVIDPETHAPIPGLTLPSGTTAAPKQEEDDMPKVKASIYSAKGELFVFSIEDMDGDPLEQFKATAENIDRMLRPALEACGVKVVDRTAGDLKDALPKREEPTPLRGRRTAAK